MPLAQGTSGTKMPSSPARVARHWGVICHVRGDALDTGRKSWAGLVLFLYGQINIAGNFAKRIIATSMVYEEPPHRMAVYHPHESETGILPNATGQQRVQQVHLTSIQSATKISNAWTELQNGIVPTK
jgi:hypothetical protein